MTAHSVCEIFVAGTGEEASMAILMYSFRGQSTEQGECTTAAEDLHLRSSLRRTFHLDKLQVLTARNVECDRRALTECQWAGEFDNPQGTAMLQIPQLVIQNQTIHGLKLQMNVADHVGNATLDSSAVGTLFALRPSEFIRRLSCGCFARHAGDTFAALFAVYAPEQAASLTGQTEVTPRCMGR